MRTAIPKSSHDTASSSSSSSSKRNFKWMMKRGGRQQWKEEDDDDADTTFFSSSSLHPHPDTMAAAANRKPFSPAISTFRSLMNAVALLAGRSSRSSGSGSITGTLYGHRRGHVHLAFQADPKSSPAVLLELATPTSNLVREMASGLVRIALECEQKPRETKRREAKKLMDEPLWRAYCNGRKCGYAVKRECGADDWKVLKAVEPVSMGAGVLPMGEGSLGGGEMMYMRARFERVVGSRDSEAFYMMNPGGSTGGGTELSIYFLRV